MDGELEPGGKMWCYCCEQEIGKHVTDGRTSVQLGGLIEHMTKYVPLLLSLLETLKAIILCELLQFQFD